MRLLLVLAAAALAGCVTVVYPTKPTPPKRHMVRLHDSKKDCDDESLDAKDRDLCDWLHGRKQ